MLIENQVKFCISGALQQKKQRCHILLNKLSSWGLALKYKKQQQKQTQSHFIFVFVFVVVK